MKTGMIQIDQEKEFLTFYNYALHCASATGNANFARKLDEIDAIYQNPYDKPNYSFLCSCIYRILPLKYLPSVCPLNPQLKKLDFINRLNEAQQLSEQIGRWRCPSYSDSIESIESGINSMKERKKFYEELEEEENKFYEEENKFYEEWEEEKRVMDARWNMAWFAVILAMLAGVTLFISWVVNC